MEKISSVFIGGGTPNMADSKYYKEIFDTLSRYLTDDSEITTEANPNLLNKEWLTAMRDFGINRLSLGVQSFFDDKLALLQRNHDVYHSKKSIELACEMLDNVSIDLIYDCNVDSQSRILQEIEIASGFNLSHISMYSLSIERDSDFGRNHRFDTKSTDSFREIVREGLKQKGFTQYEVSNFYKTKPCRHNLGYWSSLEYLGVGAGAVGRVGKKRYYGSKNIESYIANTNKKEVEILSDEDLILEEIMLGFRSNIGVRCEILEERKIRNVCDSKLCFVKNNRIYANDLFNADNLANYFI